jgi:hypothetical protein
MVLVQKRNCMSRCLKLHASVAQFFGTKRTHSHVPGLKKEALFSKLEPFFGVSANRRSVRIRIYYFVLYEFAHINVHVIYLFIGTRNFHYCENYEPRKTVFFYRLY